MRRPKWLAPLFVILHRLVKQQVVHYGRWSIVDRLERLRAFGCAAVFIDHRPAFAPRVEVRASARQAVRRSTILRAISPSRHGRLAPLPAELVEELVVIHW